MEESCRRVENRESNREYAIDADGGVAGERKGAIWRKGRDIAAEDS